MNKSPVDEEESEEHKEWKLSPDYIQHVRRAQQIAGEVLWLSTRTRPDLCFPIQKMTMLATKDPVKAVMIGARILRYLKGTKDFGIFYPNAEETKKRFEEYKEDWPVEALDEERVTVWTDSSYASQESSKSQGALVVTQSMSPVFWKCGSQNLIALSTAESELQMLVEGSLAAQNIGLLMKEVMKIPSTHEERKETIKELEEREEFNDEEKEIDEDDLEDLLCIDNKAATQILLQESGSWRTRHLRVRASALKQRVESGRQKVVHVPGRSMLADLNTKSHPYGRLQLLRKLWGIEEVVQTIKEAPKEVNKVKVKMMRMTTIPEARSSTDIEVQQPDDIQRKIAQELERLENREAHVRQTYKEKRDRNEASPAEQILFAHELCTIQK